MASPMSTMEQKPNPKRPHDYVGTSPAEILDKYPSKKGRHSVYLSSLSYVVKSADQGVTGASREGMSRLWDEKSNNTDVDSGPIVEDGGSAEDISTQSRPLPTQQRGTTNSSRQEDDELWDELDIPPVSNKEKETAQRLKDCVRCRMQRIRCLGNICDLNGICLTCQATNKQRIHTLSAVRYKLTECTIYRTGKARGLKYTYRWPVMTLVDITEWADMTTRTIKVVSDVCPFPVELAVRKFIPDPKKDTLHTSWMDGTVKRFKEITPYAIVNRAATVKDMRQYTKKHIFECMAHWLEGRDEWVQETYLFARKYMLVAPPDEASILADIFLLWFGICRTAATEWITGADTLDMEAETMDRSYPLFGKVPLPPMMIQQLDMILTLGFLYPLWKKFQAELQKTILAKSPKCWMTIYLVTFICLHSGADMTAENYQSARKHGLKRRYSMPSFIADQHHSANVYLSYYHYCTKPCNPFKIDWNSSHKAPFAEMTKDEIQFLKKTSDMFQERKNRMIRAHECDLYEDDLYFVSQMFEEEWTPRDTLVDYGDGTTS